MNGRPLGIISPPRLFCALSALLLLFSCGRGGDGGSYSEREYPLVKELDETVLRRSDFYGARERQIDSLRRDLLAARSDSAISATLKALSGAFLSYRFDSAFHYARMRSEFLAASPQATQDEETESLLQEALVLTSAGLFNESTDLLARIDTATLSPETNRLALWVFSKTYFDLYSYTGRINGVDSLYRSMTLARSRALLKRLPRDSWPYHYVLGHERITAGDTEGAAEAFERVLSMPGVPERSLSVCHANLGDLCLKLGEGEEGFVHFARSAALDLRNATRENTSLLRLSRLMMERGDLERSYAFAIAALEDATFYNAYHRKIAVGDVLPLIENRRYRLLDDRRQTLTSGILLIGLLCAALVVLTLVIIRQIRKLRKAHETIAAHNADLSKVNKKLQEADAIKDVYIGLSFYNYSGNIKKLEQLYRLVTRKVEDKKFADIKKAFDPSQLQKEREKMYENFDATFLRLFPNFIERYNALFPPEEQTQPPGGSRLTTEMRIFALIRLGITKSDEIAGFLDYSVHTINTYKTRVKNKSNLDNALFEKAILDIDATV